MPHDVFISYSQNDKQTAQAVCHALESHGIRCWIAPRDIDPGKKWMPAIAEALTASKALVLVFSSRANGSRHVAREVSIAFDEEVPIIPFRIEAVPPSSALKFAIGTTHWLDALTPPLERHLETLAGKVQSLIGSAQPRVTETPDGDAAERGPGPGAWPGLRLPVPAWAAAAAALTLIGVLFAVAFVAVRGADSPLPEPVTEPPPATGPVADLQEDDGAAQPPARPPVVDAGAGTGPAEPRRDERPPESGLQEPPPAAIGAADRPAAEPAQPRRGMDVQTATALLDRAVAAKDMSVQGQVQTLEALLAAGFQYSGADLSGIRLAGAGRRTRGRPPFERIPNSQFEGGIEYSPLTRGPLFGLAAFSTRGLAPCAPGRADNPGIWVARGVGRVSVDWGAAYDTELTSKAGRRREWVRRIEGHMTMMMDPLNARHGH